MSLRRRRQSPAKMDLPPPPEPTITEALTDNLLQQIFLWIDSPASLFRASAACAAFHDLITDDAFLSRYYRQPPPLLPRVFHPVPCIHTTSSSPYHRPQQQNPPTPVPTIGSGYVGATAPSPRQLPALSDDVLLEIFFRSCPADLARASIACVAFRRLIADPTFVRRYCSHHPPLLLGFFMPEASMGFHPVEAPHPNAAAARSVPNICFDHFLRAQRRNHRRRKWHTADVRDGRVLLAHGGEHVLPEVAVCDPLSGQYLMLPPVPHYRVDGDLLGYAVVRPALKYAVALAPPADNKKDEASFRVICAAHYFTELVFFVFDSGCRSWTLGTSSTWGALGLSNKQVLSGPHYAYGCFYWKVDGRNKLLKLDIGRMELSTVALPPLHETRQVAVVEAGQGTLGMVCYSPARGREAIKYYHYNGKAGDEWQIENAVPLPAHGDFLMVGARPGYVFLRLGLNLQSSVDRRYDYHSLDIKTLKFERVAQMRCDHGRILPYFGFPTITVSKIDMKG